MTWARARAHRRGQKPPQARSPQEILPLSPRHSHPIVNAGPGASAVKAIRGTLQHHAKRLSRRVRAGQCPRLFQCGGVARIADRIEAHRLDARPMLEGARVAIFGVNDGRRSGTTSCAAAPDAIREWFYQLVPHSAWKPTVDLGTSGQGLTRQTPTQLCTLSWPSWSKWASSPSFGWRARLDHPLYRALESVGRPMNVVTVDPRLDFGGDPEVVNAQLHERGGDARAQLPV